MIGLFALGRLVTGGWKIRKPTENRVVFFSMIVFPILMHHALFLEFSKVHDFALLKTVILFCCLIPILYQDVLDSTPKENKMYHSYFLSIVTLLLLTVNIFIYYNYDKKVANPVFQETGQIIKNNSAADEVIYAISQHDRENGVMIYMGTQRSFSPQVQWIAGRNILAVENKETAVEHMRSHGFTRAIIYTLNTRGYVMESEQVRLSEGG